MKRTQWSITALLAAAAVVAVASSAEAVDRVAGQRLAWHSCQTGPDDADGRALDDAGAQCAEVRVPFDYARPNGRALTVAIARIRATDTANRIGALVLNLGGPATPVLPTLPLAPAAMGATGARFDLVAMDPRFAGRSTPFDCGWPASWLPRAAGADRQSFDSMVSLSRDLARRCPRDLVPYASTANTARDLDTVRAALGEPRVSFLGYSQGTYLGAAYAQLFPHRVDRLVLDSAIDPDRSGTRALRDTTPYRAAALRAWAGWAAANDAQLHLGRTADAVVATVERVYQAASRHPLRIGPYTVDDTVVPGVIAILLTDDTETSRAELAATVQVLVAATTGAGAEPTPALEDTLASLLTGAGSALRSPLTAVLCADAAVSRNPEWYWLDIQAHRGESPLFAPLARDITPCAFWPNEPREAPVLIRNGVPALIVNAENDINTNLDGALAMHRVLTGSRLLVLTGVRTHGVYLFWGSACVDQRVNAYLDTGVLPAQDGACPAS